MNRIADTFRTIIDFDVITEEEKKDNIYIPRLLWMKDKQCAAVYGILLEFSGYQHDSYFTTTNRKIKTKLGFTDRVVRKSLRILEKIKAIERLEYTNKTEIKLNKTFDTSIVIKETPKPKKEKSSIPEEELINIVNRQSGKISVAPITGIYFLYDGEEIVYIGQSSNIFVRISQHVNERKKIFTHYTYTEVDRQGLNEIEQQLINKYLPKYNNDYWTKFQREQQN